MRIVIMVVMLAATLAGCGPSAPPADNGKPLIVPSAQQAADLTMQEALRRGKIKALRAPFTVYAVDDQHPLFTVSWDETTLRKLKWKPDSGDKVLDGMALTIDSTEGLSPFYDYCFTYGGDHAQNATHFCTVTLIAAMKARGEQTKNKAP